MAGATLLVCETALARDTTGASEAWRISQGGVLYDKWWAVLGVSPPTDTHPAYPASGQKKGSSTWRCKECHGWDYEGAQGGYGKDSHYTGIQGIRAMSGADPDKIAAIVRDDTHRYTPDLLSNAALHRLAFFVSRGQVNMDELIDRKTSRVRGDAKRGGGLFETLCASCHGLDGRQINFKTPEGPEYIGTVATKNPWELLHKLRNGQPGASMPAHLALDLQYPLDVAAYAQTLPPE